MSLKEKFRANKSKVIIIAVVAALAIGLGGFGLVKHNEETSFQNKVKLARDYIEKGDNEKAILEFKSLIESNPKKVEPYLELSGLYISLNDPNNAIKILIKGQADTSDERINIVLEKIKSQLTPVDINETVIYGVNYELPKEISVMMNHVSILYPVKWSENKIDTTEPGIKTLEGTLVNTDKKVTLSLHVLSIASIEDVNNAIVQNAEYSLPSKITAKMSDDSAAEFDITWNPEIADTSNFGLYNFVGRVAGYDRDVKLTLDIERPYIPGEELPVFKALLKDSKWLKTNGILKKYINKHDFVDFNQDGVNEMILSQLPSNADAATFVMIYNKGDVKVKHLDYGPGEYIGYNKSNKLFFTQSMRMGIIRTVGNQFVDGNFKQVFTVEDDRASFSNTFRVDGKDATLEEYEKTIKSFGVVHN